MPPRRSLGWTPVSVILTANVALVLLLQFGFGQDLFSPRALATLTPLLGVMVIVGLAQAFVIGTGGIDLSIPNVVALMGIVLLRVSGGQDAALPQALLVALLACIVIGLVNGVLVEALGLNALVTTLATGQIVSGLTVIYRAQGAQVTAVPRAWSTFAQSAWGSISVILTIALSLAVVLAVVVRRTVAGRRLVMASASREAGTMIGLRAVRTRIAAWMVGSLVAGIAGLLLSGQIASPDMTIGSPYLLLSIIVVVLGGAVLTGGRVSPIATALGGTFIIVLDHGLAVMGLSTGVRTLVQGVVLAVGLAVMVRVLRPRRTVRPSHAIPPRPAVGAERKL